MLTIKPPSSMASSFGSLLAFPHAMRGTCARWARQTARSSAGTGNAGAIPGERSAEVVGGEEEMNLKGRRVLDGYDLKSSNLIYIYICHICIHPGSLEVEHLYLFSSLYIYIASTQQPWFYYKTSSNMSKNGLGLPGIYNMFPSIGGYFFWGGVAR